MRGHMNTPRTDAVLNKHLRAALYSGQGLYEIELSDLSRTLERELSAKSAECQRLREALERIANSEPRPKRNRDYDASDIQSLQRTARAALQETQPLKAFADSCDKILGGQKYGKETQP